MVISSSEFSSLAFFASIFPSIFLHLFHGDDGSFTHRIVYPGSEVNITGGFLNPFFLEDNHHISGPVFLYFDRDDSVLCYHIDVPSLGSCRYLYGGNSCLDVGGKVRWDEGV